MLKKKKKGDYDIHFIGDVKILECMNAGSLTVFPIFYNVDPSHVRYQKGKFGQAFATHEEKKRNMERVPIWREALTQVANLSGWDSRNGYAFFNYFICCSLIPIPSSLFLICEMVVTCY